ncbi:MAG: alkaline phosphatase family protein [Acidobacteria bacterium]|nr:alkaline phosphatase family protein [Acidobacteriota bacterium]
MPYLRLLTNALVAGVLGAAMLAHLVLLLNPQLSPRPGVLFSLGWRLLVTAAPLIAGAFFVASLARYLSTRRGPGWLSLRILAWTTTLVVALGALLAWLNLSAFESSLSPAAARRAFVVTVTLACASGVLLVIALVHYGFGRRGSRVGGTVLGIAVVAAVVLPLVARGPAEWSLAGSGMVRTVGPSLRETPLGRVRIVAIDGASLDYVSPAAAQGRLPNIGRMIDGGASLALSSIEPRQPQPVWSSVATGRYPPATGVRGDHRFRGGWAAFDLLPRYVFADVLVLAGVLDVEPIVAADLRGAPLWRVLEASGIPAVTAAWPLSDGSGARIGRVIATPARAPGATPIDTDTGVRAQFEDALGIVDARVASVRYAALAALAPEARRRQSSAGRRALDETYDFIDREVGRMLSRLAPDDLLLVVSGYRVESPSPFERLRDRIVDDAGLAAEASRSDGFMLAYGRHVAPGRKSVGAIVDVLPTVLYYLGLPVGRDMDGYARTDLFVPALTTERPVTFIRSYQ